MPGETWTQTELNLFDAVYSDKSVNIRDVLPHRSRHAIHDMASRRNLSRPRGPGMSWTAAEVDILKTRAIAGYSSGMIADELKRTRNSVIGKAARLGVPLGAVSSGQTHTTRPMGAPKRPSRIKLLTAPHRKPPMRWPDVAATTIAPNSDPVPFADLAPHHCRYIVSGDGAAAMFCAAVRADDRLSYCAFHYGVCHVRSN